MENKIPQVPKQQQETLASLIERLGFNHSGSVLHQNIHIHCHLVTVCLRYVVDCGLLGDCLIMWSTWSPYLVDCGLIQTEEEEVIEEPRTN